MKNKENREYKGQDNTVSLSRRVWQIYLLVGFIGVLVMATLWYALSTSTRIVKQYSPLVDAAMEIKLEATTAHLWFEEVISGDRHEDINKVWNHINHAEWYAQAMLDGGQKDKNIYIPLADPKLRQDIQEVIEKIKTFRDIAKERYAKADKSFIGSDIDQRFDDVFKSFLKQAENVEATLLQIMARDIKRFRSVQFALIVLCFVLTGIVAVVLHRFERMRSINMAILNTANQQLRASEQQLQASNQQLRASEQQLQASNQQLRASEQQLQATNQQLRASEQQLKASNQQLRASESLLLKAQQIAGLGFYTLDITAGTWTSSSILDKIFGIDKHFERDVKGWLQIVHPDQRDEMSKYFSENILTQHELFNREYHIIKQDDQAGRWVHGLGRLELDDNGEPIRMTGTIQDITERKLAEEALQASKKNLSQIYETTGEVLFQIGVEPNQCYRFLSVNSTFLKVTGLGKEQVVKRTIDEVIPEPSLSLVRAKYDEAIREKKIVRWEEVSEYPSGTKIGEVTISPAFTEDGTCTHLIGSVHDLTERKRAEEALRESEEKFKTYISNAPDGIFIADSKGRYVDVNEAASQLTGYSRDELLNMSIPELTASQPLSETMDGFNKLKGAGKIKMETTLTRKDGSSVDILLDAVVLSDNRFMAFYSDITETKRLQALQSRAERLETAGKIAGQVAHDFNNLLGPMIAYPDFLRNEIPKDHSAIQMLNDIEKAATTMADINQQLLTLSRRGHFEQETLDLNSVVTQSLNQTDPQSDTLHIETDLDKNLMNIKGGPAQLSRIISNLVNNALDAMQSAGHLFIKTENYYADDVSGKYGRIPKGEYVKLTITDTGCGITNEALPKIFDPFFTTKKADKQRGSGLGLSVVYAVMEDHKGYIDLQSEFGQGTSFFLYFPITRDEIESSETSAIIGGTESILVIDDDTLQREVALNLLNKLGYSATAVDSGKKAVEFLRDNPQDLLVLDMIMPGGIDGTETYKRALELNSNQKAIIVSGFSETERVSLAMELGAGGFIRKPLTLKIISAAVRKELDKVMA